MFCEHMHAIIRARAHTELQLHARVDPIHRDSQKIQAQGRLSVIVIEI